MGASLVLSLLVGRVCASYSWTPFHTRSPLWQSAAAPSSCPPTPSCHPPPWRCASERDQAIPDQLSIVKQGLVCVSSQFDALPNCDPRPVCENTVVAKLLAVFPSVFHLAFPPLWQPNWAVAYDQPLSVDSMLWWMELSFGIATPKSNAVTSQLRHNNGSVGI